MGTYSPADAEFHRVSTASSSDPSNAPSTAIGKKRWIIDNKKKTLTVDSDSRDRFGRMSNEIVPRDAKAFLRD